MSRPHPVDPTTHPDRFLDVPWRVLVMRVVWIALRLVLVGALAAQGSYFFYQGF